ncbi:hypothetical protein [Roseibium sp. RKSG952]|uniref:hypothetical protein n=1 Tax=Roseibium sp. RKSG952 TaxID=2529384 RepID=UPI0012BBAA95|nr:hypothetical protein [Roseibium sp. RKSG952]MTH95602.1 hypothetical protein [Roseibium sp. RKSG952]
MATDYKAKMTARQILALSQLIVSGKALAEQFMESRDHSEGMILAAISTIQNRSRDKPTAENVASEVGLQKRSVQAKLHNLVKDGKVVRFPMSGRDPDLFYLNHDFEDGWVNSEAGNQTFEQLSDTISGIVASLVGSKNA